MAAAVVAVSPSSWSLPVAAAVAVVAFVVAYAAELAAAVAAFVVIMAAVLAGMRWVASPRRMRRQLHPQALRTLPAAPVRAISAPPRAIEAPRVIPAHVVTAPAVVRVRRLRVPYVDEPLAPRPLDPGGR